MSTTVLYAETQGGATQTVARLLKGAVAIFALCVCIDLFKNGGTIENYTKFLLVGFTVLAIGSFFTAYQLVTQITADGISVRFPPFHSREIFFHGTMFQKCTSGNLIRWRSTTAGE